MKRKRFKTVNEVEKAINEIYEVWYYVLDDFKKRKNRRYEKNYYVKCPKCGNKLQYRIIKVRNIAAIRCLTEGCFLLNQNEGEEECSKK